MSFDAYTNSGQSGNTYQQLPIKSTRNPISFTVPGAYYDIADENGGTYQIDRKWLNTATELYWRYQGQGIWVLESASSGDILGISVDLASPPGVSPVTPNSGGLIQVTGSTSLAGTLPAVIRTHSTALYEFDVEVQIASTSALANGLLNGVSHFASTQFNVDPTGFVTLLGGAGSIEKMQMDVATAPGTNPVEADGAGLITVTGAQIANAGLANVIRTDTKAQNQYTIEIQQAGSDVASNSTKNGVSHYNNAQFNVGANAFVSLIGGATPPALAVLGDDGGANQVIPNGSGQIILDGLTVPSGTNAKPVFFKKNGANTEELDIQLATTSTSGAKVITNAGLSSFDSSVFAVDAATGFVTLSATGAGEKITGDDSVALSPISNNWNILGRSGSKTSGATNTLTIKSPPFLQIGASAISALNTGEFVTAAVTRTLPASAGLIDGDLFIYVCTTAGSLIIQAVGAQKIRIGNQISGAAGTATSNAIGDSLTLRFNATDGFFYSVSGIGTWTLV